MKSETEEMLGELTKDDPKLKEFADQYDRQLEAAVLIRNLRENTGLSQKDLAAKANVSKSTIARIEHGNMNPTLKMLDKLGEAAGKQLTISYT